jgi:hypothetical protein
MNITNPRTRAGLAFLLAIVIIWFRAPDRLANGFLWAEDANVFIAQAHQFGKHSILLDYNGYLHLIPRLIALAQYKLMPIGTAPYFFIVVCLLLMATSSAYIASTIRLSSVALLIGLAPVLSPQGGEVLLSITNLQWMIFPVLLVLLWECLFAPPERWVALRALVTVALTLTGPFGVLVAPGVGLAAIWKRKNLTPKRIAWLTVYFAAVLYQAWIMHAHPAPLPPHGQVDWIHRIPRELFTDLLPGQPPLWLGWAMALWLMVIIAGSELALAGGFVCAAGIAIWALGAYRVNGNTPVLLWYDVGGRYLYVPLLMFTWASLLAWATARSRAIQIGAAGFAIVIMLASASRFEAGVWKPWTITADATAYEINVPPDWSVSIPR